MEIGEGFLGEWGGGIGNHGHFGYCSSSEVNGIIGDGIDVSGYEFQLSVEISLSAVVDNGDPASDIGFGLISIEGNRIIWFPAESSGSIGYFAVGGDGVLAEDFPVEGG